MECAAILLPSSVQTTTSVLHPSENTWSQVLTTSLGTVVPSAMCQGCLSFGPAKKASCVGVRGVRVGDGGGTGGDERLTLLHKSGSSTVNPWGFEDGEHSRSAAIGALSWSKLCLPRSERLGLICPMFSLNEDAPWSKRVSESDGDGRDSPPEDDTFSIKEPRAIHRSEMLATNYKLGSPNSSSLI